MGGSDGERSLPPNWRPLGLMFLIPVSVQMVRFLIKLDGKNLVVGWATTGHSGAPVLLYALGPGAKEFAGVYDNTEISKKMAKLLKIKSFPQSLE